MKITYTITVAGKTTTTRSPKAAYAIYDKAVNDGQPVETFTNSRGADLRDRA